MSTPRTYRPIFLRGRFRTWLALVAPAVWLVSSDVFSTTVTYSTAGNTILTVPVNVTSVQVTLTGAAGGIGGDDGSNQGGNGGSAGRVTGTLAVNPGDGLTLGRGGAGGNGTSSISNGGGGAGGSNAGGRVSSGAGGDAGGTGTSGGGGGGGGSAFLSRSNSLTGVSGIVAEAGGAGGGGGAGNTSPNQAGLSGNTSATYNGLSYAGGAGANRGSGNDGGGGGGGGSGKRGGAGGGLRTTGNTDSGGNGGSAGENDISGLTGASSSYVSVSAGAAASITVTYTALPSAPVISGTSTDTSVTLSWSAPASGPSITDYIVQYRLSGASSWSTFADGTSALTGATVTGLNHSSSYEFQVAAVNADGTGAYSSSVTVLTKKNFFLTLSGGSASFTLLGSAVTVDPSLTIVDETSGSITAAKIQISSGFQTGDTLSLPTGGAAVGFPGISGSYNPTNGILSLSGSGTAAVYQAALRAVTFSTTNTSTAARTIDLTLGNAIAYGGHFYEVVNSSVTWPTARSGALAKSLFGIPGYLVNITSAGENNFILQKITTTAWIGASDSGTEGTWKWMDGPEAGTTFWIGTSTGSVQGGNYANWNTGEPNDAGGAEDYASIYSGVGVQDGKWNDYGGSGPYIVEYGNPSAVISFSGSRNLNVALAAQTITFNALPGKTFGSAAFTLNATGGASGNPVTFTSSNTNVATVVGSTVTLVGAGSTTITANQAGNSLYSAAAPVPQTLTVAQASQGITFGALSPVNFGVAPFGLTASGGGSGNAVTFVSSDLSVATVSGSTVTVVGVGTTTITASQAGNGNYLAAGDVSRTLTVNSVRQSVAGTTVTLDFSGGTVGTPLSYANNWSTSDTAARPDGYAQDGSNLAGFLGGYNTAPSGVNTQLTYGFDPGSSDRYVFAWTQNISSSSADYPGNDIFGWKFLSGGTEAFSVKFLNDTTTARDLKVQGYSGAGSALTLADGQVNNLFIDRDEAWKFRATADLAGDKWSLDVWRNDLNNWYGLVTDAALSSSLTSLDGMAATWAVTASNGVAGDNIMSFDNISLQGKQTVAISLNIPTNAVYSGSAQALSPTTTPSGVAVVVLYNGLTNAPVNAGTYNVTAEVVDTNAYYSAPTSGSLTVAKATPTITTNPVASGITYGQTLADSTLSGGAGSVAGSFAFASPSTAPHAGTNSQSVLFIPTNGGNYNSVSVSVDVVVAKATPTITGLPSASGIVYGQTLADSTLTGGTASVAGTFAFTLPSTAPATGTASQGITFTASDAGNYNTVTDTVSVTVSKATPVITSAPVASVITEGQPLSSSTLSGGSATGVGGASLAGTFAFTSPGTTPSVGTASQSVTFTPTDTTNYNNATTTASVTVNSASTPYDLWADSYSLAGANRGHAADPDGDGFNNAQEFAFGTNPAARNAGLFTATKSGSNYVVTFKKRKSASEATYDVRASTDLKQAFSSGTSMTLSSATSVDASYEQVSVSLPLSGTRGFVRMQASVLVNPSR